MKYETAGSKALVVVDIAVCASCGADVTAETIEEDALLRHGGYGATRRTTRMHCRCGWYLLVESSEVRPPKADTAHVISVDGQDDVDDALTADAEVVA